MVYVIYISLNYVSLEKNIENILNIFLVLDKCHVIQERILIGH